MSVSGGPHGSLDARKCCNLISYWVVAWTDIHSWRYALQNVCLLLYLNYTSVLKTPSSGAGNPQPQEILGQESGDFRVDLAITAMGQREGWGQ